MDKLQPAKYQLVKTLKTIKKSNKTKYRTDYLRILFKTTPSFNHQ